MKGDVRCQKIAGSGPLTVVAQPNKKKGKGKLSSRGSMEVEDAKRR